MQIHLLLDLSNSKSVSSINQLYDSINECMESMKSINSSFDKISSASYTITRIGIKNIDSDNLKAFAEDMKNPKESPTLNCFMKFLESRFMVLDTMNEKKNQKFGN